MKNQPEKIINKPLVTIVTPSYNQGDFIEATIKSVLGQTYDNIQYIIADGGSTDHTMDIVNKYSDRIDIIIHEKDRGQADAINKGFRKAKGELAGWINSDDILYPDCVERIVNLYLKNKGQASVLGFSICDLIDEKGNVLETYSKNFTDRDYLIHNNCEIIQPSSFYPVKYLKEINYLNEKLHYCMDLDLWIRLLDHGKLLTINDAPGAGFRTWGGSKTNASSKKFLQEVINLLIKYKAKRHSRQILKFRWQIFKTRIKYYINEL